jgi:hypothetical protein
MSEIGAAEEAVEKIAAEDPNPQGYHIKIVQIVALSCLSNFQHVNNLYIQQRGQKLLCINQIFMDGA